LWNALQSATFTPLIHPDANALRPHAHDAINKLFGGSPRILAPEPQVIS
jgi:hypothetical protein